MKWRNTHMNTLMLYRVQQKSKRESEIYGKFRFLFVFVYCLHQCILFIPADMTFTKQVETTSPHPGHS